MRLTPQTVELLAREYALGTLHGGARRRFEAMLRESPEAARAAHAWQQRLGHLAASVPPVQPSAALWRKLEAQLFSGGTAAPPSWWKRWTWAAPSLGGAAAGVLASALVWQLQPSWLAPDRPTAVPWQQQALPPSYVGVLADASGRPLVLAGAMRQGHMLTVRVMRPIPLPAGQVARLWALPEDGRPAFAVAAVPADGKAIVPLGDNAERLFAKVSRLAVRIEPDGAPLPPPEAASADFVASGPCFKMW